MHALRSTLHTAEVSAVGHLLGRTDHARLDNPPRLRGCNPCGSHRHDDERLLIRVGRRRQRAVLSRGHHGKHACTIQHITRRLRWRLIILGTDEPRSLVLVDDNS